MNADGTWWWHESIPYCYPLLPIWDSEGLTQEAASSSPTWTRTLEARPVKPTKPNKFYEEEEME